MGSNFFFPLQSFISFLQHLFFSDYISLAFYLSQRIIIQFYEHSNIFKCFDQLNPSKTKRKAPSYLSQSVNIFRFTFIYFLTFLRQLGRCLLPWREKTDCPQSARFQCCGLGVTFLYIMIPGEHTYYIYSLKCRSTTTVTKKEVESFR